MILIPKGLLRRGICVSGSVYAGVCLCKCECVNEHLNKYDADDVKGNENGMNEWWINVLCQLLYHIHIPYQVRTTKDTNIEIFTTTQRCEFFTFYLNLLFILFTLILKQFLFFFLFYVKYMVLQNVMVREATEENKW